MMYAEIMSTLAALMAGAALWRTLPKIRILNKIGSLKPLVALPYQQGLHKIIEEREEKFQKDVANQLAKGLVPKDKLPDYMVSDIPVGGMGCVISRVEIVDSSHVKIKEDSADSTYPNLLLFRNKNDKWKVITTANNLSKSVGHKFYEFNRVIANDAELSVVSESEFVELKFRESQRFKESLEKSDLAKVVQDVIE